MTQETQIKGARYGDTYPASPTRLLLIGLPGTGKTFSAMTFPNPVVCDLDNKLSGYRKHKPDEKVLAIPFWHTDFVVKECKMSNAGPGKANNPQLPPNTRDALKYWLVEEGPKIGPDKTLVIDSWTSLQTAFDLQSKAPHEIVYSKTGQEDGFAFWGRKKQYSKEIVSALKTLSCNVVVICHETYERDESGRIVGLKALQDGSYADELPSQFTDVYRQIVLNKEEAAKRGIKDQKEDQAYYWNTNKNDKFTFACRSTPILADFIKADYKSLLA